jgi:hypothetical protein
MKREVWEPEYTKADFGLGAIQRMLNEFGARLGECPCNGWVGSDESGAFVVIVTIDKGEPVAMTVHEARSVARAIMETAREAANTRAPTPALAQTCAVIIGFACFLAEIAHDAEAAAKQPRH